MKPRIFSLFLCFRFLSSLIFVDAFASSNDKISRPTIANDESQLQKPSPSIDDDTRRKFVSRVGGLVGAAVMGDVTTPMQSVAVDTPQAAGGVKVSKRAGGLAQKLRGGVCFKMVRTTKLCEESP